MFGTEAEPTGDPPDAHPPAWTIPDRSAVERAGPRREERPNGLSVQRLGRHRAASDRKDRTTLASTLFESSELTLIANAMQERWPHWQRPTAVSNPRFRARTEALVEKLARAARRGRSRTRSVRRFSLLELKLMRLALLDRCRRLNESGLTGALAEKLAALVRGRQFIDLPENRVRWGTTLPYLLFNAAAIVG